MSDDDYTSCQWCGGDGYFEWELPDGKCKTCIVEDCRHTETYREYINDDSDLATFQDSCCTCGVYRKIRCIWFTRTIEFGPWMHDEVRMEDIS